jgi:hypothetical protein
MLTSSVWIRLHAFATLLSEPTVEVSSLRRLAARGKPRAFHFERMARTCCRVPSEISSSLVGRTLELIGFGLPPFDSFEHLPRSGIPSHPPHLRPLTYSILLGVLGKDSTKWDKEKQACREKYSSFAESFLKQVEDAPVRATTLTIRRRPNLY